MPNAPRPSAVSIAAPRGRVGSCALAFLVSHCVLAPLALAQSLGSEFQVNTYTPSTQIGAAVAMDTTGNFVVVWTSYQGSSLSYGDIFGQRYSSSGTPQGPEFRVNTYTTDPQCCPHVAADSTGNFVVGWSGAGPGDSVSGGVFGLQQQWDPAGSGVSGEYLHLVFSNFLRSRR